MTTDIRLVHGTGAHLHGLEDGAAQLVFTSPPYFPEGIEGALRSGIDASANLEALRLELQTYAWSLRPVFSECQRVLMPGGRMIVQTRDVRLRHLLVPVEGMHRQMLESMGLMLYTRHLWRPRHTTMARRRMASAMAAGIGPAPFDPEVFLVFWKSGPVRHGKATPEDVALLGGDFSSTLLGRLPASHRFQAPIPMLKALIRAHSLQGDLVVDPFCGGASVLVAAHELGRRALGADIDPEALALARINLGLDPLSTP